MYRWRNHDPKIKSFKVVDLAKAVDSRISHKIIGIRQGEKIHEELIANSDNQNAYDIKKYYLLFEKSNKLINHYKKFNLKNAERFCICFK